MQQSPHRFRPVGGFQGEGNLGHIPPKGNLAFLERRQPEVGQFPAGQPQGKIKVLIHRRIEHQQGLFDAFGVLHQAQGMHRLQPHPGGGRTHGTQDQIGIAGLPFPEQLTRSPDGICLELVPGRRGQQRRSGGQLAGGLEEADGFLHEIRRCPGGLHQREDLLFQIGHLAAFQFLLGLDADPVLGSLQLFQQFRHPQLRIVRLRGKRASLGGDAPDAAVLAVAAGIMEIDFTVLDDRIEPIGQIQRTVRTHAGIHGTERAMGGSDHVFQLLGGKTTAFGLHHKMVHPVPAEVIGDHMPLPRVREMPSTDDLQTGLLRLPGIHALQDAGELVRQAEESGPGEGVVDPLAVGAISGEGLAPLVPHHAPGIHLTHGIHFQPAGFRTVLPPAAAAQFPDTIGRLDAAVNIDALGKIQATIRAAFDAVQNVVGILRAEAAEQHLGLVRPAIPIGVLHEKELGAVGHISAAIARQNTGRDQQAFVKDGGLVRGAIAVGILQDHNLVGLGLAGLDVGIDGAAGHPETAFFIPRHLDRFGNEGFLGKEIDLQTRGHLEGGFFGRSIHRRQFLEIPLGRGREGECG